MRRFEGRVSWRSPSAELPPTWIFSWYECDTAFVGLHCYLMPYPKAMLRQELVNIARNILCQVHNVEAKDFKASVTVEP